MSKFSRYPFYLVMLVLSACTGNGQENSNVKQASDSPLDADTISQEKSNVGLDILNDYDKDLWDGPSGWSDTQWRWKRELKWDKQCDYVGEVDVLKTSMAHQLIRVICVPGSYQPTQYLFLYNPQTKESQQLLLGENGETTKDVLGHVNVDDASATFEILHLSRGAGDCGSWRQYQIGNDVHSDVSLAQRREQPCSDYALSEKEMTSRQDPKNWPLAE